MKMTRFADKFSDQAGINTLMDDLGKAMAGDQPMIMMGGGNPGHFSPVQERLRQELLKLAEDPQAFSRLIGNYDAPQGEAGFIRALVELLNDTYGWSLTEKNIALTNGSQAAFFMLFNLFAGQTSEGEQRQILLPLAPEYLGYADAGVGPDTFRSLKPKIDYLDEHRFKYRVDFDQLEVDESVGALCVSRPTNPTGNLLTDEEIDRLHALAKEKDIPLIIDGAYGSPFPELVYTPINPIWDEQVILCLSLSKLGLPAARTGIVIAAPEIIRTLSGTNAILNLATGSFGPQLMEPLVRSGELISMSRDLVRPWYEAKMHKAVETLDTALGDRCPWYLHQPEGAMFLWLWFPDLPISSQTLYERLKARGVLVVSGHHFFPGMPEEEPWQHRQECIRVTYSQDDEQVARGLEIIAEEVVQAYAGAVS
ncbi:valine--pyruvate transaminase [Marinospirillum perlucidum]|uniref:valine--pyruvate transaminase n=1 Tax=Marinospirillum perlucidum TaxID=1982602 RepID=UPI000DF43583|nr:valine--pyruvate transaminase [Marinospirillum perlucidum]